MTLNRPQPPKTPIHPVPGGGPYGIQVKREPVRRSWLVVSSIDDDELSQAWTWGADVVVLDLEDTVHDSNKAAAREKIQRAIGLVSLGGAEVFVRPDLELLYADLDASTWHGLTGVVLPKVRSLEQVLEAEQIIDEMEQKRGVPGVLELHLCMETPEGNFNAVNIVEGSSRLEILGGHSRVRSISLGRADLVMDLRGEPSGELHTMPYLMHRLVTVARAAGVEPIGAWWRADSRGTVASPEATLRAAHEGRRHGFKGSLCRNGDQVASLNRGFTPSQAEVDQAATLVQAFEDAQAQGKEWGELDGQIVYRARAQTAQELITYADLCAGRDQAKAKSRDKAEGA